MATSQFNSPTVRYIDTTTAYDLWSEVYDSDGNFLQALDTIEMKYLLPKMLAEIGTSPPWRIVDLGCGTGRNTAALLAVPNTEVVALDVSTKMLDVARSRLRPISGTAQEQPRLKFEVFDLLQSTAPPVVATPADAIISTLVIEHIPLDVFFNHVSQILKPNGVLLLTNMHSEMGGISQAGFVDPKTGEKIRPQSYAHTIAEIEAQCRHCGMELVGKIEERCVDEGLTQQLGDRSKKWIGVMVWFGGVFRKVG